jgi:hypothetical protein
MPRKITWDSNVRVRPITSRAGLKYGSAVAGRSAKVNLFRAWKIIRDCWGGGMNTADIAFHLRVVESMPVTEARVVKIIKRMREAKANGERWDDKGEAA